MESGSFPPVTLISPLTSDKQAEVKGEPVEQLNPAITEPAIAPETVLGDSPKTLPQRCQRVQENQMQCPRYSEEGSKFCHVCNTLFFAGVK